MLSFEKHNQAAREIMSPKERQAAEEEFYELHGRPAYRSMALAFAVAMAFMVIGTLAR